MSKFIEVTINDGIKILINTGAISSIIPDEDHAYIYFLDGEKRFAHVAESYEEIKALLNA